MQNSGFVGLREYLGGALGLEVSLEEWGLPVSVPVFLGGLAEYGFCRAVYGSGFVVAAPREPLSLPGLKRIPAQLGKYIDLPVVLVDASLDPRQRRALVAQGVAFVCPGKQAFLPFLAFTVDSTKPAETRPAASGRLSPRAQAVLVAMIANPGLDSTKGLLEVTGLSAATVSRGVGELAARGLIVRAKKGREAVFHPTPTETETRNGLLHAALPLLSTPVVSTRFVVRDDAIDGLPDGGETALAQRSLLQAPPIVQKVVLKGDYPLMNTRETIPGEHPDEQIAQLQLWGYPPLVAGLGRVDDVSLGASLAASGEERIVAQLNQLFCEEGLWD